MASLNKVILIGNLVADPELKKTPSGVSVTSFRIAVARRMTKEQQQDPDTVKADFFDIVAWRNNAEFVCNYFSKGKSIIVVGEIQVRSYKVKDGSNRYVTEVVADEVSFTDRKAEGQNASEGVSPSPSATDNSAVSMADFVEIPTEDLPF